MHRALIRALKLGSDGLDRPRDGQARRNRRAHLHDRAARHGGGARFHRPLCRGLHGRSRRRDVRRRASPASRASACSCGWPKPARKDCCRRARWASNISATTRRKHALIGERTRHGLQARRHGRSVRLAGSRAADRRLALRTGRSATPSGRTPQDAPIARECNRRAAKGGAMTLADCSIPTKRRSCVDEALRPKDAATLRPGEARRASAARADGPAARQHGVHGEQIRVSRRAHRSRRPAHRVRARLRAECVGARRAASPRRAPRAWRSPPSARPSRRPASWSANARSKFRARARRPGEVLRARIVPRLDGLELIARAITPPNRTRRFDARFFMADAEPSPISSMPRRNEEVLTRAG